MLVSALEILACIVLIVSCTMLGTIALIVGLFIRYMQHPKKQVKSSEQ